MTGYQAPIRAVGGLMTLLFLTACSPDGSEQEPLADVSSDYLTTLLVEQDFDAWPRFYQPDALLNGSQLGVQVMQGYARGLHHAFPDMTLSVVEQIAAEHKVVTRFVIRGTHKRAFNTLPPTNRRIELEGVAIDHFRDGLIVNTRLMLDVSRLNTSLMRPSGAGA